MAQIHYIWWGKPAADDARAMSYAADAPSAMADLVGRRHKVHYWRQPGSFHPELSDDIAVHELSLPSSLLEGTAAQADHAARLDAVVETLTRYGAWAAVKDVLSFAVLLRHGGFYFDTTTEVSGVWRDTALDALAAPPQGPRVPFYGQQAGDPGGPRAGVPLPFPYGVQLPEGSVEVPDCDVWAMYAPPGSAFCRAALACYLAECAYLGLDHFPARGDTDAVMAQRGDARDGIISTLSTTSILLGLDTHARESGGRMDDLAWETVKREASNWRLFPQGAHAFLPALGLHKFFAGFWRGR